MCPAQRTGMWAHHAAGREQIGHLDAGVGQREGGCARAHGQVGAAGLQHLSEATGSKVNK